METKKTKKSTNCLQVQRTEKCFDDISGNCLTYYSYFRRQNTETTENFYHCHFTNEHCRESIVNANPPWFDEIT